jgi:hypothetical protein
MKKKVHHRGTEDMEKWEITIYYDTVRSGDSLMNRSLTPDPVSELVDLPLLPDSVSL